MFIDRNKALDAFRTYTSAYDIQSPRIALKIEHSMRVADLCDRIAQGEHFPTEDCDLAWLIGLLHDMGRFEQLRRWNTFSDAQSTSHATLSVEALFCQRQDDPPFLESTKKGAAHSNGNYNLAQSSSLPSRTIRLRAFLENSNEDNLIHTAIAEHSSFRIPEQLPERTKRFCTIVRDADKLDILHVMQNSSPETIMNATMDELQNSKLSPAVIQAFNARRCVQRAERHYPADYVVGFLCFAFELEYPTSRQIALDAGEIFFLAHNPFGMKGGFVIPETKETFARMGQELQEWLHR